METHKQTWWDKEIKSQFNDFKSWVGSNTAESKIFIRDFLIQEGYNSVIDFGCGMCDDFFQYNTIPIKWMGIEGSVFLYNNAKEKEIPVLNKEAHNTGLPDNVTEVAYSRHVLEHQKDFKPILSEMIRVATKLVVHIFFIKPRDKEIINYNPQNNLYHNTYDVNKIEEFILSNKFVEAIIWKDIPKSPTEQALIIKLKSP